MRNIREVKKYRRERFRWLPQYQEIESQEFSEDIQEYRALEYLTLWVDRLGEGYEVVFKLRDGERRYTIIEIQEDV